MKASHPFLRSDTLELLRTVVPRRWARWLTVVGLWTLISVLSASHWSAFPPGDYPYAWWELYRGKLLLWYVWGLLTPLILHLGWRYRIERPIAWSPISKLTLISLVVTILYLLIYTQLVLSNITLQLSAAGFGPMLKFVLSRHSTFYFLAFWATIGLEHAVAYYHRYNDRQLRASQLETLLAQAQLASVRARLQPHFLFNALHSVVALMKVERTKEASSMLTAISDLLRATLSHMDQNVVTLRDELSLLRQYVAVEKIRFADRLTVTESFAADTLLAPVPSFLLQPLVENAIKHGIESSSGVGQIELSGTLNNGMLRIEISDNGPGPAAGDLSSGLGTGLAATRERLQAMYGDHYELALQPRQGGGASTVVAFPCVTS